MKSIIEFSAIFVVGILNHIIGSLFYSNRLASQKSFTTTENSLENLLRSWVGSVSGILVVLVVALNQSNGLASVGIITNSDSINDKNPVFIGILAISFYIVFITRLPRLVKYIRNITPENKNGSSNPAVIRLFQYQSILEKLSYLSVLPFSVISEELIYRGYLVLMLGGKTHTYLPWIILSVILSIIIHLYQGRKASSLLFQATGALLFIALTIWTGNIFTSIIAHFGYNTIWAVEVWKKRNDPTIQPPIQSKGKSIAYIVFIVTNLLLLLVSFLAVSYVGL
jgi:membrane protease YdiL (CAAX protease family)